VRVLVVGIDGAEPSLVERWVSDGVLPNLGTVINGGVYSRLTSTPNYISASAWTSFATGVNPGKHGVMDFIQIQPGTYQLEYADDNARRCKALWDYLSAAGLRSVILGVPVSFPVGPINGVQIAGWLAPDSHHPRAAHPADVIAELKAAGHGFPTLRRKALDPLISHPRKAADFLVSTIRQRAASAEYLLQKKTWDVGVSAHSPDVVCETYRAVDDALGRLLRLLGTDDTLIVLSDHGFSEDNHASMYLGLLLERMGLTKRKSSGGAVTLLTRGMNWCVRKSFRTVPMRTRAWIQEHLPVVRDRLTQRMLLDGIDWRGTTAFSFRANEVGEVRLNLSGREPSGTVAQAAYEEVCRDLSGRLSTITEATTGESLVTCVRLGAEVYSGPCADRAPDLYIDWAQDVKVRGLRCDGMEARQPSLAYFQRLRRSSGHAPEGILAMRGPGIEHTALGLADIMDVAPTILHLLGQPVPLGIDGRVLEESFAPDLRDAGPVRREDIRIWRDAPEGSGPAYTQSERRKVEERLRNLGYI